MIVTQPVRSLVFPERATVQLCHAGRAGEWEPFTMPGVVASVRVFARYKNDYDLGPFVSDADGQLVLTARALRAYAAATLDTGIMDYARIEEAFPFVELRVWTGAEVAAAMEARRTWGLLAAEQGLWPSAEALVRALREAPNARLRTVPNAGFGIVRDLWDGADATPAYRLLLSGPAAA